MANSISKNQFLAVIACFSIFIGAGVLGKSLKEPIVVVTKQDSALNFNSDLLKILSFGQKRVLADLFWIATLLESDIEHYKSDDLNSWMYLRFKTLFELDPKFLTGYRFAGKYLSIVKDDLQGAREIFEQGLAVYPNDYQLNFDAGFLYGFELGEYAKAKEAYSKALQYAKAPDFLRSLVHKFDYEMTQDKDLAFKLLFNTYNDLPEGSKLKTKMRGDLYSLKAEIDLKCLNSGNESCSNKDFLGNDYIFDGEKYKSKFTLAPYKLKKREEL